MAAKKKPNFIGISVFLIILAGVIVGTYLYITGGKEKTTKEIAVTLSEKDTLLKKDIEFTEYPASAREVVKLYGKIVKCMYNDEMSEEDTKGLMRQLRVLYANELLMDNPEDEMLTFLLGEIKHYKESKMSIYSVSVDAASKAKVVNNGDDKRTIINMYFTIREGAYMNRSYEEFVLKWDDNTERWKILGWRVTDDADVADPENY